MSGSIIGMQDWIDTPPGRYLLRWEQDQIDAAVANVFGYHALQLGLPALDGLRANRMPSQWLASDCPDDLAVSSPRRVALITEFSALPFPSSSMDLVVLPHTLEFCEDAHATLREVERVLVPEGRVVITGFNPGSLWAMQQRRYHVYQRLGLGRPFLPETGEFLGFWRLRDWLKLLSLELESHTFGCYRPGMRSESWLQRFQWMDRLGPRWWPILGAGYVLVGVKRVRGMRLLGPAWKSRPARLRKSVPVANYQQAVPHIPDTDFRKQDECR
jgi:SAM-dependent methyltransferase